MHFKVSACSSKFVKVKNLGLNEFWNLGQSAPIMRETARRNGTFEWGETDASVSDTRLIPLAGAARFTLSATGPLAFACEFKNTIPLIHRLRQTLCTHLEAFLFISIISHHYYLHETGTGVKCPVFKIATLYLFKWKPHIANFIEQDNSSFTRS